MKAGPMQRALKYILIIAGVHCMLSFLWVFWGVNYMFDSPSQPWAALGNSFNSFIMSPFIGVMYFIELLGGRWPNNMPAFISMLVINSLMAAPILYGLFVGIRRLTRWRRKMTAGVAAVLAGVSIFSASTCVSGCSNQQDEVEPLEPMPTKWGPSVTQVSYQDEIGVERVYLIQTPTNLTDSTGILIYYHGANHDENQGMKVFVPLRGWAETNGWIYVSPRDYEIDGLLTEMEKKYGKRDIYLIGASAGGGYIYRCASEKPDRYSGIFLLGPAMWVNSDDPIPFSVPTYIVYGDKDGGNTSRARLLVKKMKEENKPIKSLELDGGHDAPYPDQSWWGDALKFILNKTSNRQPSTTAAQISDHVVIIRESTAYLAARQHPDGSFGEGNMRMITTSFALMLAMRWYIPSIEQERIDGVKAAAWLRQNTPSTDEEKIAVILALSGFYTVSGNPVTRPPHGKEDKTVIQALLDSIKTRKDTVWFDLLCITKLPSDIERPVWATNDNSLMNKYLYPEATFGHETLEDYIRSLVFAAEKRFLDVKAYAEYCMARNKAMTPVQMKNGAFAVQEEGSELSATAAAAMCYAVEDRVAQRFFEFPARKEQTNSAPVTINM
jgi:hypothetical protein